MKKKTKLWTFEAAGNDARVLKYNAFVQKTPNFRREGTNVWRSVLDARN